MKKLLFSLSLLCIFFLQINNAQPKIYRVQTSDGAYNTLEFVSANTGWIVTAYYVKKTTDAGKSWETMLTFDEDKYEIIYSTIPFDFVNENVGYVVSQKTTYDSFVWLFKTTDGGEHWTKRHFFVDGSESSFTDFKNIYFANEQTGWVSYDYNKIAKTEDGGATWTKIFEAPEEIYKIYFQDEQEGFLSTNSHLLRTTDGGNEWTEIGTEFTYYADFSVVGNDIWVMTYTKGILLSTDGGNSWSKVTDQTFNNLHMINNNDGIAGGYITTDGGITWTQKFISYGSVSFFDRENVWYFGLKSNLYFTSSMFDSSVVRFPALDYRSVKILNDQTIIAALYNGAVVKSYDAGKTWEAYYSLYGLYNIYDIAFADELHGVAVGTPFNDPYPHKGFAAVTDDGGRTWNVAFVLPTENSPGGKMVSASYSDGRFLIKTVSRMLTSTDYGQTWANDSTGFDAFNHTMFVHATGFGEQGGQFLLKSTNYGKKWETILNTPFTFFDFTEGGELWARTDSLRRSKDLGATWEYTGVDFNYIHFENENLAIACGPLDEEDYDSYSSYLTTDGGSTWVKTKKVPFSSGAPSDADFHSPDFGFVANGISLWSFNNYGIVDSVVTEVREEKSEQPKMFTLYQNYPNPFNPSTKIEFSLKKNANANLTVYNTLGEKVTTLLNRTLSAGKHSVIFDAKDLPTGVYLLKLQCGNYSSTKKMLLIK